MFGFGTKRDHNGEEGKTFTHRPTWVEIDLGAIFDNVKGIMGVVGAETGIIAVVKADAYGHGLVNVSKRLIEAGVAMFGVTLVEDAVEMRENGIETPILILGCILPEQIDEMLRYSITPTVVNLDVAKEISLRAAQYMPGFVRSEKKVNVHVKIDTGIGGFGIAPGEAINTIMRINTLPNINLEGIFTHFTSADSRDKTLTYEQINLFKDVVAGLESAGIHIPLRHAYNSAAVLDIPLSYFNVVRPGIGIYGLYPSKWVSRSIGLKQAMTFKTRIVNINEIEKGKTVSYHRTFKAQRETLIATLPVGYNDGYRRELSNRGVVLVRGQRAPVVGVIRMDFCYIDVTDVPDVKVGDEVVIFGMQGKEVLSTESIAESIGAIPYELTCGIGKSVPRIYI